MLCILAFHISTRQGDNELEEEKYAYAFCPCWWWHNGDCDYAAASFFCKQLHFTLTHSFLALLIMTDNDLRHYYTKLTCVLSFSAAVIKVPHDRPVISSLCSLKRLKRHFFFLILTRAGYTCTAFGCTTPVHLYYTCFTPPNSYQFFGRGRKYHLFFTW